jgi:putative inorganic carbon (hco3(-)) transporter
MKNAGWFVFIILFLLIDYARPQDIIPFIGKMRPAMFITFILFIFVIKNYKQLVFLRRKQIRLIYLFIGMLAILVLFAKNHHAAFKTTLSMLLYMPLILSMIICIDSIERLKKVIVWLIIFMIFQSLYAITHGGVGTGGIVFDENDLSLFVNTWLPFCYAFMMTEKKTSKKLFFALCLVLGFGAIVVSFSRGGFLGMIAMIAIIWLASSRKVLTIISVISFLAIVALFADEKYWTEMKTSSDSDTGTGRARIESWKAGWVMFIHNPIGVGGNNFQIRFQEYQTEYFKRGMWGRVAHSIWFTLLPEVGIIGTFIFFLLVYHNFKDLLMIKKSTQIFEKENRIFFRNLYLAFFASFAGFFVSASFLSVLYYSHFWYLTALVIASANVCNLEIQKMELIESEVKEVLV